MFPKSSRLIEDVLNSGASPCDQHTQGRSSSQLEKKKKKRACMMSIIIFFFLEVKSRRRRRGGRKAERTFFQLWERLDGRGGFVWEQNVGWEVL